MRFFRNFSNLYGEDKNLLDSQISWEFATNILKITGNDFRKIRKNLEKRFYKVRNKNKSVLTLSQKKHRSFEFGRGATTKAFPWTGYVICWSSGAITEKVEETLGTKDYLLSPTFV